MEKTHGKKGEIEIDLLELLSTFKKKIWMFLLAAIIGGIGAGGFSKFGLAPVYSSTAMVYVLSKETTLTSLADLQIGSQLTKDYMVMVTSRPVLEKVIEEQGLATTYGQLKSQITIENPKDTRILSITVKDTDPVRAKSTVDKIAKVSSDYIGDIMEMIPPKIIETGVVDDRPFYPDVKKNAAMGSAGLMACVCFFIIFQVIMNDTVRTEEDVEKYLDLSVLASIPDDKNIGANKKEADSHKKSRKKVMK